MAVAFSNQGGTPVAASVPPMVGTTSVQPALPATINNGNIVLIYVGCKYDTASVVTPTGWTLAGSVAGGGTGTGNDSGPTRTTIFYRIKDAAWAPATMPTITVTSGNSAFAQAFVYSNATGLWDVAASGGTDAAAGTAWSVTTAANPGITAGDMCFVASTVPTDIGAGATFSAQAITATGVSAWGTATERSEPHTGQGNDSGGMVFDRPVTTGTSTAAPVITATAGGTTTNIVGTSLLVRLREMPVPLVTQAAYRFYADGAETTSTALAAQDTAPTIDVSSDTAAQVRVRMQMTNSAVVPSTDDWQLQWEKNASGTWNNVIDTSTQSLTDAYTDTPGTGLDFSSGAARGQTTMGEGRNLARAGFFMSRTGAPTGTLTCVLYAHSGTFGSSGVPTGPPLATSTPILASTLAVSATNVDFTFDGLYTLVNGTPYCLAIEYSSTFDAANFPAIHPAVTAGAAGNSFNGTSAQAADFRYAVYTTPPGSTAVGYNSANLTAGAATTNRLGAGTGSFVAGEVAEDGLALDLGWSDVNYTELLYSILLQSATLTNADTLRFRVLRNAATTGMTYTAVPTINVVKPPPGTPASGSASLTLTATGTAVVPAPAAGTASLSLFAQPTVRTHGFEGGSEGATISTSESGAVYPPVSVTTTGAGTATYRAAAARYSGFGMQANGLSAENAYVSFDRNGAVSTTMLVSFDFYIDTWSTTGSMPILMFYGYTAAGSLQTLGGAYLALSLGTPRLVQYDRVLTSQGVTGTGLTAGAWFRVTVTMDMGGSTSTGAMTTTIQDATGAVVASASDTSANTGFGLAGYAGFRIGKAGTGADLNAYFDNIVYSSDTVAGGSRISAAVVGAASLSLSGSATAVAGGGGGVAASGAGALTLSATGGGRGAVAGAATLTLSGTAVAAVQSTATAALTLTAVGVVRAAITGSGSLVMTGSGAARAPTTATAALSLSAIGTATVGGGSTASLSLSATGTARVAITGSASLTLSATVGTGSVTTATLDAIGPSSAGANSTTSPLTWSHPGGGSPSLALVWTACAPGTSGAPSLTVTYGGVTMTANPSVQSGGVTDGYGQWHWLLNPPSGTQTVSVAKSGTGNDVLGGSLTYNNAGTPTFTSATGLSASPSLTVTGLTSNDQIAFGVASGGPVQNTYTNCTERIERNVSGTYAADNIAVATATGASSVSASIAVLNDYWVMTGAAIPALTSPGVSVGAAGTASLSLSATGTATSGAVAASGTASLAFSGSAGTSPLAVGNASLTLTGAPSPAAVNPVVNIVREGTFETSVEDAYSGLNATVTRDGTEFHSGTQSLAVTQTGNNSFLLLDVGVAPKIWAPVTPGKPYGVSLWIKQTAGATPVPITMQLDYKTAANANTGTRFVANLTLTSSWQQLTVPRMLAAPSNAVGLAILLHSNNAAGTSGAVWRIDDIQMSVFEIGIDAATAAAASLTLSGAGSTAGRAAAAASLTLSASGSTTAAAAASGSLTLTGLAVMPIAAYGMDGSGSTIPDRSGNGNTGTIIGAVTRIAGHASPNAARISAARTDGDRISIPRTSTLEPANAITVMAWKRQVNTVSGYRALVSKSRSGTYDSYAIYAQGNAGNNQPTFTLSLSSGNYEMNSGVVQGTNWYHLAGTYDGSYMRFFIDGVEVANQAVTGTLVYDFNDLAILGSAAFSNESAADLDADDVRIFNTALTAAQITGWMNTPVTDVAASGGAGSITLSAAGSASAPTVASASLSLTASGAAQVRAVGTAALALTATGTARAGGASTASLALSAAGTATVPTVGTASLTLSASGTGRAVAAGNASLTLSGSGATSSPAASSASLTLSATGSAGYGTGGTASLTLSGSGTVGARAAGSAAVSLTATGTAESGVLGAAGTATLTLSAGAGNVPVVETFDSGLPAYLTKSAGVTWDSTLQALQSSGNGDYFWLDDPKWYAADFDFSVDITIGWPGTRDICNIGFWTDTSGSGTTRNGFMFRVQTLNGDGGFYSVSGGTHTYVPTATIECPALDWDTPYRVRLVGNATTGNVTAQVTRLTDMSEHYNKTYTMPAGNRFGTFGQKADGLGISNAQKWDNITLVRSGGVAAVIDGTASLSLSGSASAGVRAAGTASLTLSGSSTTSVAVTGSGSLALSATGAAQVRAAGTASVALSAVGTARAAGASTASLTLSASGTASTAVAGVASLTFSGAAIHTSFGTALLTLSASGATSAVAAASASLTLSGAGTAGYATAGSGSLSLTAVGTARSASGSLATLSLSAAGTVQTAITGNASLAVSGAATAAIRTAGSALLTFSASASTDGSFPAAGTALLTLSAAGTAGVRAAGTAALTLSGSATTQARAAASASLSLTATGAARGPGSSTATLTLSASGTAATLAAGSASLNLTGTGTAGVPGVTGTASLTLSAGAASTSPAASTASLSLSATGTATTPSTSTASLTLSAVGTARAAGTSSGLLTLSATGTAVDATLGATASAFLTLSATAAAGYGTGGTASLTLSASAITQARAAGSASLTLSGSGSAGVARSATASLTLTAAATAQVHTAGVATLSLSAVGVPAAVAVTGAASLQLNGIGSTSTLATAAGTASLSLIATATAPSVAVTGSASITLAAGPASAQPQSAGSAALSLTATGTAKAVNTSAAFLTLNASGTVQTVITGTATLELDGSGAGAVLMAASGSATLELSATGRAASYFQDITIISIRLRTSWTGTLRSGNIEASMRGSGYTAGIRIEPQDDAVLDDRVATGAIRINPGGSYPTRPGSSLTHS